VKNKHIVVAFVLLSILSALYRVFPYEARPVWLGAPQLALAVFAGSVIQKRGMSFMVVLLSMLFSDVLIQLVHFAYPTMAPGFYKGQIISYIIIVLLTAIGFMVKPGKWMQITGGLVAAPVLFFLVSNLLVWASGGGYQRPFTWEGLVQCYGDGIPFLRNSLSGTLIFGSLFFGVYQVFVRTQTHQQPLTSGVSL